MLRTIQYAVIVAYLALTAWLYPRLPERFPIHFNVSGEPDSWVNRSILAWFGLPLVAIALCAFLNLIGSMAASQPNLWNIPRKKEFLALTPAQREPITQMMRSFMTATSIALLFLFVSIQVTMYQVAIGDENRLPWHSMAGIIVSTVGIIIASLIFTRAVGKAIERESARAGMGTVG